MLAVQAAIPGNRRAKTWVMRRVKPGDAPAPAKAGDRGAGRIPAARRRESQRRVEILHRRGVGGFGDDRPDRVYVRRGRRIANSGEEIRRDGKITQGREAARDVADMIVEAENLLRNQNDWTIVGAGGLRQIGRRLAADARLQRLQPGRGGRNFVDFSHCRDSLVVACGPCRPFCHAKRRGDGATRAGIGY